MRGREFQWQEVLGLLARASKGTGGVLLMEGEPGMGKSLFLDEAGRAGRENGFSVLTAAAEELSRFVPLAPLLGAVGQPPATLAAERAGSAAQPMPLVDMVH